MDKQLKQLKAQIAMKNNNTIFSQTSVQAEKLVKGTNDLTIDNINKVFNFNTTGYTKISVIPKTSTISGLEYINNISVEDIDSAITNVNLFDNRITTVEETLENKSDIGHTHTIADITDIDLDLDSKADIDHTHVIEDITDYEPYDDTDIKASITTNTNNISSNVTLISNLQTTFNAMSTALNENYMATTNPTFTGTLNGYNIEMSNSHPIWPSIPVISSSGVMEVGRYMDWHYQTNDSDDNDMRMTLNSSGTLSMSKGLSVSGELNASSFGSTLNQAIIQIIYPVGSCVSFSYNIGTDNVESYYGNTWSYMGTSTVSSTTMYWYKRTA